MTYFEDLDSWPEPPSFDVNAPIQYPMRMEPSFLMKRFRGQKISSLPAPFIQQRTDEKNKTSLDLEMIAREMDKNSHEISDGNPFKLDLRSDPFAPPKASFFSSSKSNSTTTENIPRPCLVPKRKKRSWNSLSIEEQKELYSAKKIEFIEYLQETFALRLELQNESSCMESFNAYERCLGIKNILLSGTRYSTARQGLTQIYACHRFFRDYNKCIQDSDTRESENKLIDEDRSTIQRLFSK